MCGERVEVTQLTSCSSWGSTMDGHRFFLGIDPLPYAIQRCPACGYSSPCLSSIEGVDTSVVTREWLSDIPLVTDDAEHYGFTVKKGRKDLVEKLNKGIKIVRENGTEAKLKEKWMGAAN